MILVVAAGAFLFRVPRLDQRPMHCDEAVHTVKAGAVIETGKYIYDPSEYHGPTIYYFALPFVWLRGAKSLVETDEFTFRIVPVIFGTGLVLLLLFVRDGLGTWPAVIAAVLTAVSPAMVFYSRYYIQEMLLVFFTFGVLAFMWRSIQTEHFWWAVLAGMCAGLMHATKETCIIAFAAMGGSFVCVYLWARWRDKFHIDYRRVFRKRYVAIGVVMAFFISAPLLSGFFRNPRGELDAWLSYANYLHRADGAGIHDHPWHYYLEMLIFTKNAPGPWWSEGLILALALVGIVVVLLEKPRPDDPPIGDRKSIIQNPKSKIQFRRFIVFYTILLTVAYSIIPYKTPWCMLGFLHGMILLAGIGAVAIIKRVPTLPVKAIACLLLALGVYQLGQQAYRGSFKYYADTRNPYVYAHTASDIFKLVRQMGEFSEIHPDGHDMLIKVITPDYWPLPWYLRAFNRIGYWHEPIDEPDAPVVITNTDLEEAVAARLKGEYQPEYFGLRPEVLITVFVEKTLWDAFIERQTAQM